VNQLVPARASAPNLPALVATSGASATRRFLEFFASNIRNRHTRLAYSHAVGLFLTWCEERGVRSLGDVQPLHVAAWIEAQTLQASAPTVKQRLAAIRHFFDWLVVGQIVPVNPAASVRGPKHIVRKDKTPVLEPIEACALLDSIDTATPVGLRDRALIGLMVYSFAWIGAALGMKIEDVYSGRRRLWVRLHEKGGKRHEVPVHHKSEEYLDAYLHAAGMADQKGTPLWRSMTKERGLSDGRMNRQDVFRMIKRRCQQAELCAAAKYHTLRATGSRPIC
jgi:integrase/recombinase XerC